MDPLTEEKRKFYAYIVVGCGGVGSATVYWLSRRVGSGVLGLEKFRLGHANGGSQDHSRQIRLSYLSEPYPKLLPDAYKAWEEIEAESGLQILYKTGGLGITKKDFMPELWTQYKAIMDKYNVEYEQLNGAEITEKFPQFTLDENTIGFYEETAGFVDAAIANGVHTQLARSHGANIIENCSVTSIHRAPSGLINVDTTNGNFECRRLIVTSGAWTEDVLKSIGVHIPISVTQEQVTYLATPNIKDFTKERFPTWFYGDKDGLFYGFPIHGNSGVKVSLHGSGKEVTADTRDFTPDKEVEEKCIDILRNICPTAIGPILYTKTCLYATTPDRDFVVDNCEHVGWPDVIVCVGAGHIFKFAGLMGKILCEMAVDGKTQYDLSTFRITREAITDPKYQPHSQKAIRTQHKK